MVKTRAFGFAGLGLVGLFAVLLTLHCTSCATPAPEPRHVTIDAMTDVAEGAFDPAAFRKTLPRVFLVARAADVDHVMAVREKRIAAAPDAAIVTVIDASELDHAKAVALADRLVEAALDPRTPILVDLSGKTARSLADGARRPLCVRVAADATVAAAADLDAADADLAGVFGEKK